MLVYAYTPRRSIYRFIIIYYLVLEDMRVAYDDAAIM